MRGEQFKMKERHVFSLSLVGQARRSSRKSQRNYAWLYSY